MPDDSVDVPLTEEEAAALRSLRRDVTPPPGLEDRVTAAVSSTLTQAGPPQRMEWKRWAVLAAAAVLAFFVGRASVAQPIGDDRAAATGESYALLLLAGDAYRPADGAVEEQRRVDAYRDWAARLTEAGRFVTGEELMPAAGNVIGNRGEPGTMNVPPMVGMFIVEAAGRDTAEALAATLPHLVHGGEVAVVPIVEH